MPSRVSLLVFCWCSIVADKLTKNSKFWVCFFTDKILFGISYTEIALIRNIYYKYYYTCTGDLHTLINQ